jgi:hypothetical protein
MPLSPNQASGIFWALEPQDAAARSLDAIRERFFRRQIAPGFHPGYKKCCSLGLSEQHYGKAGLNQYA